MCGVFRWCVYCVTIEAKRKGGDFWIGCYMGSMVLGMDRDWFWIKKIIGHKNTPKQNIEINKDIKIKKYVSA